MNYKKLNYGGMGSAQHTRYFSKLIKGHEKVIIIDPKNEFNPDVILTLNKKK